METVNIGNLDRECEFCGALSFKLERGRVSQCCCHNGKIALDNPPEFPKKLRRLFLANSARGIHFRKYIRFYNKSFSMASFYPEDEVNHHGFGSVKIGGHVNAWVTTSLIPNDRATPRNAQIYLCEPNEALKLRQFETGNSKLSKMIAKIMYSNPYVGLYKSLFECYRENPHCESVVYFLQSSPRTNQQKTYDLPAGLGARTEVGAVLITGKDGNVPQNIEFEVYPKNSIQCQTMHKLSQHAEPMMFPFLFPQGQSGYSIHLQNHVKSNIRRVTAVQYFGWQLRVLQDGAFNPSTMAGKLTQQYILYGYIVNEY